MMPILSIVIANYNYGRFLEDAIKSVLDQDGFDRCELIVVDGASTDNSVEVIRKYESHIAWWVSEKDRGQSDAFNKGFAHARGQLGCWVNADDVLLPGALKAVIDYVKSSNERVDWIGGAVVWLNADMKVVRCSMCQRIPYLLQWFMPGIIVGGPSSFFRLDIVKRLGGLDTQLHYMMDHDLWLRLMKNRTKLHMLKRYVWAFRLHEESKTACAFSGEGAVTQTHEQKWIDPSVLNARYPKTMRWWHRICKMLTVMKLLNGTYLRSWLDTRRNFGKPVADFKQGGR